MSTYKQYTIKNTVYFISIYPSYEKYIGDVSKFFDNFSKKLIKNAEVFEELDALLNKQLSFDDWRP